MKVGKKEEEQKKIGKWPPKIQNIIENPTEKIFRWIFFHNFVYWTDIFVFSFKSNNSPNEIGLIQKMLSMKCHGRLQIKATLVRKTSKHRSKKATWCRCKYQAPVALCIKYKWIVIVFETPYRLQCFVILYDTNIVQNCYFKLFSSE